MVPYGNYPSHFMDQETESQLSNSPETQSQDSNTLKV